MEQYDNEYDDYDESMYYENDHSFTTKTTPTTTTTTTALPTTTVEKGLVTPQTFFDALLHN